MRAISDYIETLTLRGGDRDGELFELLPWERSSSTAPSGRMEYADPGQEE